MKKVFQLLGVALFATVICLSLASCGDKDKDEPTQQQPGGDDPGPGPGPGPGPDPQDNPFEGMTEGQVKVNFQGQDIVMEYPYLNYYYELPASGGLWIINFVAAKADRGGGYVTLPQARLVADLATGQNQGLNPYLNWFMTENATKWDTLLVTYTDGSRDTFQVGDYFYGGSNSDCGAIVVDHFNYRALTKQVTARVTVKMFNFDEATSGVENPSVETVTFYFYKFQTSDQLPQGKSMTDPKMRSLLNQKVTNRGRVVNYRKL